MRNRSRHSASPIERLRLAIDCLPVRTREAMLDGVRSNERIIVGAYVDDHGGVCPMLAAHRCGGRTDFLSFAKSWDRFTHARGSSRAATVRELRILLGQLEASLEQDSGAELDVAIAEHRQLVVARRRAQQARRREAEPTGPIKARRLRPPTLRRGRSEDDRVTADSGRRESAGLPA